MKSGKFHQIVAFLFLTGSQLVGGELEMVSVRIVEREELSGKGLKYQQVSCSFESIFSLDDGKQKLAIRLENKSKVDVNVSKLLLGLDESYEVKYKGIVLPNAFNNHQALDDLEKAREKLGLRWLVIKPENSILISLDPTDWQSLEDLSRDEKHFEIELTSNLFQSQKALVRFSVQSD